MVGMKLKQKKQPKRSINPHFNIRGRRISMDNNALNEAVEK